MGSEGRKIEWERKTRETKVILRLNLDGKGKADIKSGIPFFDHMLTLFAYHGLFDLVLRAQGDQAVDDHHLTEDIGISLGEVFAKASALVPNINRYGTMLLPMDDALVQVALDISGRPYLVYQVKFPGPRFRSGFDYSLLEEFWRALVSHAGWTLHIQLLQGKNNHHIAEALFKGVGKSLAQALQIERRRSGVPSTKGKEIRHAGDS